MSRFRLRKSHKAADEQVEAPESPPMDEHPFLWALTEPPIGTWITDEGSFSNVSGAVLMLLEDGRGVESFYGSINAGDNRRLLWRQQRPAELQIAVTDKDQTPPESDADWDTFTYRCEWRLYEDGYHPVLTNDVTKDGWITLGGFWTLTGPVRLREQ